MTMPKLNSKDTLALLKEVGVCGAALTLIVLHLLGYIPAADNHASAAPLATQRVPVECFASGECRAMFPVPSSP